MIRPAKLGEIPNIIGLARACALHMIGMGIEQWNDLYPSEDAFLKDHSRGELYVMEASGHIVGCITVSSLMDEEYKSVQWLTPNRNNIYVHRLAVLPEEQGKGLGRQLMDWTENRAKYEDRVSVRLDTFSRNKRNQRFYEARGYQKLEPVYFPNQSPYPFYCYELIL